MSKTEEAKDEANKINEQQKDDLKNSYASKPS